MDKRQIDYARSKDYAQQDSSALHKILDDLQAAQKANCQHKRLERRDEKNHYLGFKCYDCGVPVVVGLDGIVTEVKP